MTLRGVRPTGPGTSLVGWLVLSSGPLEHVAAGRETWSLGEPL